MVSPRPLGSSVGQEICGGVSSERAKAGYPQCVVPEFFSSRLHLTSALPGRLFVKVNNAAVYVLRRKCFNSIMSDINMLGRTIVDFKMGSRGIQEIITVK